MLIPIAAGLVLGIAARLVDDIAPRWVGNIGPVWFLAGFFVGRTQRSLRAGATSGAVCLVVATLTYYAWRIFIDGTISLRYLTRVGFFWLLACAVVGVISGAAGAKSQRWSLAWGIAIGVLLGEAAAVALLTQRWEQILLEVFAAAGLFVYSKRPLAQILSPAVAAALVVASGSVLYRITLR